MLETLFLRYVGDVASLGQGSFLFDVFLSLTTSEPQAFYFLSHVVCGKNNKLPS